MVRTGAPFRVEVESLDCFPSEDELMVRQIGLMFLGCARSKLWSAAYLLINETLNLAIVGEGGNSEQMSKNWSEEKEDSRFDAAAMNVNLSKYRVEVRLIS